MSYHHISLQLSYQALPAIAPLAASVHTDSTNPPRPVEGASYASCSARLCVLCGNSSYLCAGGASAEQNPFPTVLRAKKTFAALCVLRVSVLNEFSGVLCAKTIRARSFSSVTKNSLSPLCPLWLKTNPADPVHLVQKTPKNFPRLQHRQLNHPCFAHLHIETATECALSRETPRTPHEAA